MIYSKLAFSQNKYIVKKMKFVETMFQMFLRISQGSISDSDYILTISVIHLI